MLREIPRNVEVLVKKAAVDPAFKKLLMERRAAAAETIALKLEPAEAAMLEAVPEAQLRAIVANTKVSPSLRPAFLGYAAGAMLAALTTTVYGDEPNVWENVTFGNAPDIPPETAATVDVPDSPGKSAGEDKSDFGVISGTVTDNEGNPLLNVMVSVVGTNRFAITNADGYYLIKPVPAGVITVEAFSAEYGSSERTDVKIIAGLITSLTFQYTTPPLETPAEPRIKYNQAYQGIRPDIPSEEGD